MSAPHTPADHAHTSAEPTVAAATFWEEFYAERDSVWSGRPNPLLVAEVADLAPGTALDLGCGEGADAVWLAGQGWRVTAVDVSATALRRGVGHAEDAGVADRVVWQRHDLQESFPDGTYDLVSAQFFHTPPGVAEDRTGVLRRAAAAVAPGGRLLVAGHAGWPSWMDAPPYDVRMPSTDDVRRSLALDPQEFAVEHEYVADREITGPEGQQGTRPDNVLRYRRLA